MPKDPSDPPTKPTLSRVAAELGVSPSTVSNAFNRPERLSEHQRRRVLEGAARLGYAGPDPAARQLRRGRSDTLGLLFTDDLPFAFRDPAAVGFLEGLAEACETASLNLLLVPVGTPAAARPISAVAGAAVDGFIVYSMPDGSPHLDSVLRRGLPVVLVDEPFDVPGTDWVGSDDRASTAELGAHLRDLGHRSVGVISTRLGTEVHNGPVGADRLAAARYAVQRNRVRGLFDALPATGGHVTVLEERYDNSVPAGAAALHSLLDRHPELTAVCCLSDVLAIGALEAARARGLSVPGDLTITGYDDIPEAGRAGLTTVSQPLAAKGRIAGELLLSRPGRSSDRQRFLATRLVVRDTSAPPAAR